MRYEGPIYRPPSEADSLLVQATVGCPYNKCTFCMVYKQGPPFRVRPSEEVMQDLDEGRERYGDGVRTLFLPAGNTIAMPTGELTRICAYARRLYPSLERITVYGSSRYIHKKGLGDLVQLRESGLSRIHVGLESGDEEVLRRIKKGTHFREQVEAGLWVREAGIELNVYVILGIGGKERSRSHAVETARVLNAINPEFIRFRTFLPKKNTLLLHQIRRGAFQVLSPHEVLRETREILERLRVTSQIRSDHYTNYVDIHGALPDEGETMLAVLNEALLKEERCFRPVYVGTE
jgi:radical SAM superfamily enzyme YgiQ (UPF0313 family)